MRVVVDVTDFRDIEDYFEHAGEAATEAMRIAINDTTKGFAVMRAKEEITDQVNFPSGYLSKDRLGVIKLASNSNLEAVIRGRDRPTSLARFIVGGAQEGQRSPLVAVHKGGGTVMRGAFVIKLKGRGGQGNNRGLAIRLPPGERVTGRRLTAEPVFQDAYGSLFLLYGPSVDQVFGDVADEITPEIQDKVVAEFFRQFVRLTNG
jgi:hypothetical protein